MVSLPDPSVYQYFSHLYHSGELIPFDQYQPLHDWQYPPNDLDRFQRMFGTDSSYWRDQIVLDLGCHVGFHSACALHAGARHVHGVNVRSDAVRTANYAFEQLKLHNSKFTVADIEQSSALANLCDSADTVILALVLEMLRSPYQVLQTITDSTARRVVIESEVFSTDSTAPMLRYYRQSTASAFSTWQADRPVAMGCVPNTAWLESVLYDLGWSIEHYSVRWTFSRNWFAQPGLYDLPPKTANVALIMAHKNNHQPDRIF